jgi:outer membrane protein insertion porin family
MLLLLGTLCSSCLAYAQSQVCVDGAPQRHATVQETKISIIGVEFQGENPLSDELREQLTRAIRLHDLWTTPEKPDSTWVDEALYPIREALQSEGYFKTDVDGAPYLVRALPTEKHYVLAVKIETGPKYYVGKLRFTNADPDGSSLIFADDLLRQQVPLKEGELFDVSKIRKGLEAIRRLYGSRGYIDATPEPDTTIDEKEPRIDLLIRLDQQQRYHIAKLEFLGLATTAQKSVTAPQEIGDPFNRALWENFLEANKAHFPPDASPDKNMRVLRNVSNATVDVTLDFRPCPKTQALN